MSLAPPEHSSHVVSRPWERGRGRSAGLRLWATRGHPEGSPGDGGVGAVFIPPRSRKHEPPLFLPASESTARLPEGGAAPGPGPSLLLPPKELPSSLCPGAEVTAGNPLPEKQGRPVQGSPTVLLWTLSSAFPSAFPAPSMNSPEKLK